MFFLLLCVAGNETTRNSITRGMHGFFESPDQWELYKSDPDKYADTMVDEVVRWATPVLNFRRQAMRDHIPRPVWEVISTLRTLRAPRMEIYGLEPAEVVAEVKVLNGGAGSTYAVDTTAVPALVTQAPQEMVPRCWGCAPRAASTSTGR